MKRTMSESTYDNKLRPGYYENNYANMAAAFVVETERWELASTLFPQAAPATAQTISSSSHGSQPASGDGSMTVRSSSSGQRLPPFVRSLAAALKGSLTEEQTLGEVKTQGDVQRAIGELEVAAVA